MVLSSPAVCVIILVFFMDKLQQSCFACGCVSKKKKRNGKREFEFISKARKIKNTARKRNEPGTVTRALSQKILWSDGKASTVEEREATLAARDDDKEEDEGGLCESEEQF